LIFDDFFGLVVITPPNALGELVSFSQILLAHAFAQFGFVFRELLGHLVRSCRSIDFLVTLPLPRVCSSPVMPPSIVLVSSLEVDDAFVRQAKEIQNWN
jgi:hypothetical protein